MSDVEALRARFKEYMERTEATCFGLSKVCGVSDISLRAFIRTEDYNISYNNFVKIKNFLEKKGA